MPPHTVEIKPDAALALAYLDTLWPDPPPGYLLVWTLDHHWDGDRVVEQKRSRWFRTARLGAVAAAVRLGAQNVYLGCALSPTDNGPDRRCRVENALAIPGLWGDIDVFGPTHKSTALPPDLGSAVALARSMPLPPSFLVGSGYGVYPWWLFKEPWFFDDDGERQKAIALAKGWEAHLHRLGRERGWRLDSTADFARVLRLPGSLNRKHDKETGRPFGEPVLATVEIPAVVPRYDPKDVRDALPGAKDMRDALPGAKDVRDALPKAKARTPPVKAGPDDRELALAALAALSPARAVAYASWIDVGMALHDVADDLLEAWDGWSRTCPAKYQPGACAAKWRTFTRGGGIGLGSLVHWATEDGWAPPHCRYGRRAAGCGLADGPRPALEVRRRRGGRIEVIVRCQS
jgi:hypothetical protein